jgi:hypothetical protein
MFASTIGFLFFGAMGAAMIWQPQYITRLTGLELSTVDSRNETRAVYGGLGAGLALAFFIAMVYSPWRQPIALVAGLAMLGMSGARGYSAWLERPSSPLIWGFMGIEALLAVIFIFFAG